MSLKSFKPKKFTSRKSIEKYLFYEKMYLNGFYNHSKYSFSMNNLLNLKVNKKKSLNPIRNNKLRFLKKSKYDCGLI